MDKVNRKYQRKNTMSVETSQPVIAEESVPFLVIQPPETQECEEAADIDNLADAVVSTEPVSVAEPIYEEPVIEEQVKVAVSEPVPVPVKVPVVPKRGRWDGEVCCPNFIETKKIVHLDCCNGKTLEKAVVECKANGEVYADTCRNGLCRAFQFPKR
jgi:hypothetical protein